MGNRKIGEKCDAFISWNHSDEKILNQIIKDGKLNLADSNITVWDSNGSGAFGSLDEIKNQIDLCETFIIIISVNSIKSKWVFDEFMHAYNSLGSNNILPIIIDFDEVNKLKNNKDAIFDSNNPIWNIMSRFKDNDLSNDLENIKQTIEKMILNNAINKIIDTRYDFTIKNFYKDKIQIDNTDKLYIERTLGDNISEDDLLNLDKKYILVYSNGGMGKTELLKHLNNKINHSNDVLNDNISLYFTCKEIAKYLTDKNDKYIYNFILDFFTANNISLMSDSLLNGMLNSNKYKTYLLFDSFDEIMDEKKENIFIDKLKAFMKAYPNVKIIISSRNQIFDLNDFYNIQLNELNDEKIKEFGKNLFIKINSDGLYEDFYVQLKDIDDEIKGNPLFLSQLIFIYKIKNIIPLTKIEILENTIEIATIKIDKNRNIKGDIEPYLKYSSRLLSYIAYNSLNSNNSLLDIIKAYLINYHNIDDEEELDVISADILSFFEKRTIIKEERISPKIFYDFYASKYIYTNIFLNKKVNNASNINDLFLNHYFDSKWNEALKLLICKIDNEISIEEAYKFYYELFKNNYIDGNYDLFYEILPSLKNQDLFKKIIITDLLIKSVNNILNPYQELFYYIPEYNLYDDLLNISKDLINDDINKNFILISIIRDLCYISKDIININEITNDQNIINKFQNVVLNSKHTYRNALDAIFYDLNPDWLEEYKSKYTNCNIHPFYFNIECMSFDRDSSRMGLVPLTSLFEDELGLYKHQSEEKNGEYIGLLSTDLDVSICKILSYYKAKRVREIILNPKVKRTIDPFIYTNKILSIVQPSYGILKLDLRFNGNVYFSHSSIIYGMKKNHNYKYHLWNCEEIPNYAFGDNGKISSIIIPNTVKKIGKCAFFHCKSLEEIKLPNELVDIGKLAFRNCESLIKLVIPKNVKKIEESAFCECKSLKEIEIPKGIKEIEARCFLNCISLENIVLPDGLEVIDDSAFAFSSLKTISIPSSVKSIGGGAFSTCPKLEKVIIPDSSKLEIIYESAFFYCVSLKEINLPNNLEEIRMNAFDRCESLESITLPKNLKYIGEESFFNTNCKIYNNSKLSTTFLCNNDNEIINSISEKEKIGVIINACEFEIKNEELILKKYYGEETELELPINVSYEGVLYSTYAIGSRAFAGSKTLKKIKISNAVNKIDERAFLGCNALEEIYVPSSVERYGANIFARCTSLKKVYIEDGALILGDMLFKDCISLKDVRLPNSLISIGLWAFASCIDLEKIIIPDGVQTIGDYAFESCLSLTQVSIPKSVKCIETDCFRGCGFLEEIIIPDSVYYLGPSIFEDCTALKKVVLPNTISSIPMDAFSGCNHLEDIVIP